MTKTVTSTSIIESLSQVFSRESFMSPGIFGQREWLFTNGLGGYASSTIGNLNSRCYHGLLVASIAPAGERLVILNRCDEFVSFESEGKTHDFPLSTNQYPGTLYPQGYLYLERFTSLPVPEWQYTFMGATLKKRIMMEHGKNRTVIQYENTSSKQLTLKIRPMLTYRNFHDVRKNDGTWAWKVQPITYGVECSSNGLPFYLQCSPNGEFKEGATWYNNVQYAEELMRGLRFEEDLYAPGTFEFTLGAGESCMISASLEKERTFSFSQIQKKNEDRLGGYLLLADRVSSGRLSDPLKKFFERLTIAADQFIVRKPNDRVTILAGYHWFEDWGRDTFISLPGLLLATHRFTEAKDVILSFVPYIKNGVVPNFINSDGTAAYNSIDASLWFIYAVYKYVHYSGDRKLLEKIFPTLEDIVNSYRNGTLNSIKADRDGLLMTGPEGAQLTWMDAKNDTACTPRWGKAVEINALWYNVLCMMDQFEELLKRPRTFIDKAEEVKQSFAKAFWSEKHGYLFDTVQPNNKDASMRPNQIMAVAMPFKVLSDRQERMVVDVIEKELFTPLGLRTLSVHDPRYHGVYQGDHKERNEQYHQGTVWAWLLGPYLSAYLKVHKHSKVAKKHIENVLLELSSHTNSAGVGTISEIFDGDFPHQARGTIAQAWSVAECLRLIYEHLLQ